MSTGSSSSSSRRRRSAYLDVPDTMSESMFTVSSEHYGIVVEPPHTPAASDVYIGRYPEEDASVGQESSAGRSGSPGGEKEEEEWKGIEAGVKSDGDVDEAPSKVATAVEQVAESSSGKCQSKPKSKAKEEGAKDSELPKTSIRRRLLSKSLRSPNRRNSVESSSRMSLSSFRSLRRRPPAPGPEPQPPPPPTTANTTTTPVATPPVTKPSFDSRDLDSWQAGVTEALNKDSFTAVNPFGERPRRAHSVSSSHQNQPHKTPIESEAWTVNVAYKGISDGDDIPEEPEPGEDEFLAAVPPGYAARGRQSASFGSGSESRRGVSLHGSSANSTGSFHSFTPEEGAEGARNSMAFGGAGAGNGAVGTHAAGGEAFQWQFQAGNGAPVHFGPDVGHSQSIPGLLRRASTKTSTNIKFDSFAQDPAEKFATLSLSPSENLPLPTTASTTGEGFFSYLYSLWKYVSRTAYLYILLGLPALYFTRVVTIFDEANIEIMVMKQLVLDTESTRRMGEKGGHSASPPAFEKLKRSWQHFIDTLIKEWKTLNIISVLLLSAILSLLQIESANADPLLHYAAIYSLVCALISLLLGCVYIVRFNTMRKPHKAIAWAQETQKELQDVGVFWNVWILLALPAIWLTWSLVFYVLCIIVFLWRGDPTDPPEPFKPATTLAARCIITGALVLAVIYGGIVIKTFIYFGAPMDRRFKKQVRFWMQRRENELKKKLAAFRNPNHDSGFQGHVPGATNTWSEYWDRLSMKSAVAKGETPATIPGLSPQRFTMSLDENSSVHSRGEGPKIHVRQATVPMVSSAGVHPKVRFEGYPASPPAVRPQHQRILPERAATLPTMSSPTILDDFRPDPGPIMDEPEALNDTPAISFKVKDYAYHDPSLGERNVERKQDVVLVNPFNFASAPLSVDRPRVPPPLDLDQPRVLPDHPQPSSAPRSRHRRYNTYANPGDQKEAIQRALASSSAFSPGPIMPMHISAFDSVYSGFFNRSGHPVQHSGRVYPTAAHLFEAMKYMKHHPELGEKIRVCGDVDAVFELSLKCSHYMREDWVEVSTWKLERILYLKFTQHPELRKLLLDTHPRTIVCSDLDEVFRSLYHREPASPTQNAFGDVLVRVRERLRGLKGTS
ncbi:hypothetical protein FA15DRAFT_664592 [Coprinopsis marcescibilis]|uniref:NADAR domain-containing protein n=1 Tax=Coprinopsis marcescibilis TaxID=230819 RepID=A0A5C3L871_COPMA|nr:hypothetical protein FA15DRAFT_664592 [Coprinopsis marcescibilis]